MSRGGFVEGGIPGEGKCGVIDVCERDTGADIGP